MINEREDDSRSLLAAAAAAASSCSSSCREQLQGAVTDFYSHVVPRFSPDTFKSYFRMNRTTFEVSKVYAFHTFSGVYHEVMCITASFPTCPKRACVETVGSSGKQP